VNEEEFVAEVVDPVSAQPVAADREGFASGELVLTNLGRPASPVVRYRTGDAVRLTRVPCACGRHTAFLAGGVPGRVDDMLVIRGVNLYPSALENLIREVREVEEFAVEVQRRRSMAELRLRIETRSQDPEGVAGRLRRHLECNLPLRAEVEVVAAGSLPRPELKARRFHFLDGEPAPARRPGA
jgi:phenylacetate-CoA ligase